MQTGHFTRSLRLGAAIHVIVRRVQAAVVVAGLLSSSACYTYAAVPTTQPLVEQRAEFRLNDQGRVQLQRQLGPGALTVEGRVVQQGAEGWTLRVYRMTTIRGDATTWTGEVVEVPSSAVELVQRRDFDRQRTVLAAAGVVGVVTLFVLSRNLFGLGFGGDRGDDPGPIGADIRF